MHPAYCAPRPLSPVLPARRALPLTNVLGALPTPPKHFTLTARKFVNRRLTFAVQSCSVQSSGRDGYNRHAARRVLLACTLNCTCLCEYRSYGSDGARSSQSCSRGSGSTEGRSRISQSGRQKKKSRRQW